MWAQSKGALFSSNWILKAKNPNFLEVECIIHTRACRVGAEIRKEQIPCDWWWGWQEKRRLKIWPVTSFCEVVMNMRDCGLDSRSDVEGYGWDCVKDISKRLWDGMMMIWAKQRTNTGSWIRRRGLIGELSCTNGSFWRIMGVRK